MEGEKKKKEDEGVKSGQEVKQSTFDVAGMMIDGRRFE